MFDISDFHRANARRQAFILSALLLRRGIVAERAWTLIARAYGWLLSDAELSAIIGEARASLKLAGAK